MLIKLTGYDGGSVYVDPEKIVTMRDLPVSVTSLPGGHQPVEHGQRTKIDTASDVLLVKETADEVADIIRGAKP